MSLLLIRYVLTAAIRDRLLVVLFLALIAGSNLALFLGSAAITEKQQFIGVFAGTGLRIAGVLGLVLFVVFHVRRSFEAKDIEFLLARPVSRGQFLLSFAAAFSLLALVMAVAEGCCLLIISGGASLGEGHLLWIASVAAENIIMVNTAFFFSMVLNSSASAAMATSGLYILCRVMGQLLGIMHAGLENGLWKILNLPMKVISSVMPRLDLMGQTSWLVYGSDQTIGYGFILAQCFVFSVLVLIAALIDLARRKF